MNNAVERITKTMDGNTILTVVSEITGKRTNFKVNIPVPEMIEKLKRDDLVQNIFPELNATERELIMTGIGPDEWDRMFKEEEN